MRITSMYFELRQQLQHFQYRQVGYHESSQGLMIWNHNNWICNLQRQNTTLQSIETASRDTQER